MEKAPLIFLLVIQPLLSLNRLMIVYIWSRDIYSWVIGFGAVGSGARWALVRGGLWCAVGSGLSALSFLWFFGSFFQEKLKFLTNNACSFTTHITQAQIIIHDHLQVLVKTLWHYDQAVLTMSAVFVLPFWFNSSRKSTSLCLSASLPLPLSLPPHYPVPCLLHQKCRNVQSKD